MSSVTTIASGLRTGLRSWQADLQRSLAELLGQNRTLLGCVAGLWSLPPLLLIAVQPARAGSLLAMAVATGVAACLALAFVLAAVSRLARGGGAERWTVYVNGRAEAALSKAELVAMQRETVLDFRTHLSLWLSLWKFFARVCMAFLRVLVTACVLGVLAGLLFQPEAVAMLLQMVEAAPGNVAAIAALKQLVQVALTGVFLVYVIGRAVAWVFTNDTHGSPVESVWMASVARQVGARPNAHVELVSGDSWLGRRLA